MQSLNEDERKQVLGEVLADELKAIKEYVQDVPAMKQELHHVTVTADEILDRLNVIEHVLKDHEFELKSLKQNTV